MKRILLTISIIITLLIFFNIYWWVKCAITFDDFEDTLAQYLSVFPEFMSNGRLIASIRLLLIGINLSILIYFINKSFYLIFSVVLLSVNALIFMWTLFSLM
jgi:hypothetical protein